MAADAGRPEDVAAPEGAIAWTPAGGFTSDPERLAAAVRDGLVVRRIEAGVVRGVGGSAPLVAVLRMDRELADMRAEIASLYERLHDVAEFAADRFASRR